MTEREGQIIRKSHEILSGKSSVFFRQTITFALTICARTREMARTKQTARRAPSGDIAKTGPARRLSFDSSSSDEYNALTPASATVTAHSERKMLARFRSDLPPLRRSDALLTPTLLDGPLYSSSSPPRVEEPLPVPIIAPYSPQYSPSSPPRIQEPLPMPILESWSPEYSPNSPQYSPSSPQYSPSASPTSPGRV